LSTGKIISNKSIHACSIDGKFWFANCQNRKNEELSFYKQTSDQIWLASKFYVETRVYDGNEAPKDKEKQKLS
jgi:hypothetical protein